MRIESLVTLVLVSPSLIAQEQDRQIWDTYFGKSRPTGPAGQAPHLPPRYRPVPARADEPAAKAPAGTAIAGGNAFGITIWKLEPSNSGDQARLLVAEGKQSAKQPFTPHRLQAGEPLRHGDRVRLSVESPAAGYLYLVDQELRADGSLGPPFLIFPTTQSRGGDNQVRGGKVVEIPAQTDDFVAFRIEPRGASDVGELLTLIVTPQPIPGLKPAEKEQQLPEQVFAAWLSQYKSDYQHFELVGGEGQAWTRAEQQAGLDGTRLLTPDDPAPQTVFFFPDKAGNPLLASIRLQVRAR